MDKVFELKNCVNSLSQDSYKFFNKRNKAAGVRARKKLQKCKELSQEIRTEIQKVKQEEAQKKAKVLSAHAAITGASFMACENSRQNINLLSNQNNQEKCYESYPGRNGQDIFDHQSDFLPLRQNIENIEENTNLIDQVEGYNN